MEETQIQCLVNPGKQEKVEADGKQYLCYAIKSKVVTSKDDLGEVVMQYAAPFLEGDDILFISEKMVACTQGRAIPLDEVKPGLMARVLSRFVVRTSYGIGLAMPETMQCAIDECGRFRILVASFCGMVGKIFRQKGWFYRVAGYKAAAVDGPCDFTLPPYNHYVVMAPKDPDKEAASLSKKLGGRLVLVVDINDLGGTIMGASDLSADREHYVKLLKQNPLGQAGEQTPMGLLRPTTA